MKLIAAHPDGDLEFERDHPFEAGERLDVPDEELYAWSDQVHVKTLRHAYEVQRVEDDVAYAVRC